MPYVPAVRHHSYHDAGFVAFRAVTSSPTAHSTRRYIPFDAGRVSS